MTIETPTTDPADETIDALTDSEVMGTPERASDAMKSTGRAGPGGQQAASPKAKPAPTAEDKPKNQVDSGIEAKTALTPAEAAEKIQKLLVALQGKRDGFWLRTYPDSLYGDDAPNVAMQFYLLQLLAIVQPQSFTSELQQLLTRFNPQNPQPTIQAIIQQPALAQALNHSVEKLTAPAAPLQTAQRTTEPMVQTRSGRMITVGQLQDILGRMAARREHIAQQRRPRRPRMPLRQGPARLRRPRRIMPKPIEETIAPKTVEFSPPVDIARLESNRESNRAANDDRKTQRASVRQPRPLPRRVADWVKNARAKIAAR